MIYFDNASTSFPKADGLADFVKNFIETNCFNVNRGSYASAEQTAEIVFETRDSVAKFFNAKKGKNVVFSSGVTQSLNVVIKGLLKSGDSIVTSSIEHNAVYRPLYDLSQKGVDVQYAFCNNSGEIDLNDLESKLKQHPKMLVMTHASNVCGAIMPIKEIGAICKKYDVLFILDSAQSAGVLDIDVQRDNIDVLCFTGHKGLLALQGVGGCVFSDRTAQETLPLIHGGTGSFSHLAEMPTLLPDKFEAGTLNLTGIASLRYTLQYIEQIGIKNIFAHEKELQNYFESAIADTPAVKIVGKAKERCAVTALDFTNSDNGEAAFMLDEKYTVMTRSGLHCSPLAHKTLGTFPRGVVRVSFGHKNTKEEVDVLIAAIKSL